MPDLNPVDEIHTQLEQESDLSEEQVDEFKEFVSEYYYEIQYGPDSLSLQSLYAESFQNIVEKSVFFGGSNKIIHGFNSQGKTSFLKALQFNLLGLPNDKQAHQMTNLIRDGQSRLHTRGEWLVDDSSFILDREMVTEGRGGSLQKHDEPTISELSDESVQPPEERDIPRDRHNQPSEVFEKIGILPLVNRDYDPYELMSLYLLMPHDFLHFLNWHKAPEVIDIIFGIHLTNVVNAIEDKQASEAKITDAMAEARSTLDQRENKSEQKEQELTELRQKRERLQSTIADKNEQLDALKQGSDVEPRLNELRSRKSVLQSKLADLKTQRSENVSKLGEVERRIQRYEDSELVEDIGDIGDELRSLMTVPDRCPVCTNPVDGNQRERLLRHQQCPLCEKDVNSELLRVEQEYQPNDSLFDRREEQKEELEELESRRDELEFEIDQLEGRIESTEAEIDEVEETIEEQNFEDVIDQRESIEREIRELRNDAANTEVKIETVENEIERLEYDIWANEHLADLLDARKEREEALDTFLQIVFRVRRNQRRKLQSRLREEMENELLSHFEQGMFADVRGVSFDSDDNYHFTLHAPTQQFKSTRAEREAAEATLHALLFHTSVLKLLSDESNAPPVKMLVIDSPMTNDMDSNNRHDVGNLITSLPNYLEEYQLIISMADSDSDLMERFENSSIPMEEFSKSDEENSQENNSVGESDEARGAA